MGPRSFTRFPVEEEAIGPSVLALVEEAAAKGPPRPAVLGLGPEHVEQYDLLPLLRAKADVHRFVAAVAGQEGLEAVGLVGTLGVRFGGRRNKPQAALVVFFEWSDGRWWSAVRPLHERKLRDDWPALIRTAEEGHPRPGGLGGWWSRARFEGLRLQAANVAQGGAQMVH